MKIFLDDVRNPPDDSWTVARTYNHCIALLFSGLPVEVLSLDHDIACYDEVDHRELTGYHVAQWVEESVATDDAYTPPGKILCHSANPVGRARILETINSIQRMMAQR